jgi:hypothetical protein
MSDSENNEMVLGGVPLFLILSDHADITGVALLHFNPTIS